MNQQKKDQAIAAGITFVVMLLILLSLFFGSVDFDRRELAAQSIPEIQPIEEEELFLEPEILHDLGEENAVVKDAPAKMIKGEPEPAKTDNNKLVVKGENPKPAPASEKLVTQKTESPVKATEPTATKEERQKVTSSIAKGFAAHNGAKDGADGSDGAGGVGIGINGQAGGRTFKGCPKPDVSLRQTTTVTVSVVIDANGNVTSAKASGGSSAAIRRACEQAARGAKWSEKKGAAETRGSITFTITPR